MADFIGIGIMVRMSDCESKKEAMMARAGEFPTKWDHEAEVVVVGYGGAGAAAAIAAHDTGAAVLILEKAPVAGGTTAMSGGIIVGAGTSVQRERGITDSPGEMRKYYRVTGRGLDDPDMVKVLSENSGPNIEWLIGMGMEFIDLFMSGSEDYPEYAAITPVKQRGHSARSGGAFFKVLKNACDKRGLSALYETQLKEIIAGSRKEIIGVKAESKGKTLHVKAKKAVVLTCGGYAYNTEMLKQYSFDKGNRATYTGSVRHTGDGIRAGQMLGADLRCMGQIGAIPAVQRPGKRIARIAQPPENLSQSSDHCCFVAVNKKGERFTNETGFYNYVAYDMLVPGNLPNYMVFDEKMRTIEPVAWPPWSGNKDKDIEDGTTKKAETIKELATKIGVDPYTLEKTISDYNGNAQKGVDPEFGRTLGLAPIQTPPFYAFERIVGMHSTFGGLKINTAAQVINVNGAVIRRLYAGGETTGGTIGFNYPASGTAIQNAICFGRIAGKNAAAETSWQ
ncbi:MAG: FAD-binding protein [Desulfobacteraceae bacterium]|nr:FAD-binding protein [Desulfobacteraceae bacterium]